MDKVIFVDRDGVINVDPIGDYIKKWEDFRFESGALEGLKMLSDAGYEIIIISNQAGIGDGVYPASELSRITANMIDIFKKENIRFRASYFCHHGKNAGCECRKPKTGLFKQAVQHLQIEPSKTYFIGDKITDVQAGKAFGLKTIMVKTGHGKFESKEIPQDCRPDILCDSLLDAARLLNQ